MAIRFWIALVACALFASCDTTGGIRPHASESCSYDRAVLMALDEQQFDQDSDNGGGGWRSISAKPGCESSAADLIRHYREVHKSQSDTLYWHEAQLRASSGDYARAIPLMERAYKPKSLDGGGWNPYVDATIAFLRNDKGALIDARARLEATQPSPELGMPPVKNGFIELPMANGQMSKISWPPNLDVVDGLVRCFGKAYAVAYSKQCRVP